MQGHSVFFRFFLVLSADLSSFIELQGLSKRSCFNSVEGIFVVTSGDAGHDVPLVYLAWRYQMSHFGH